MLVVDYFDLEAVTLYKLPRGLNEVFGIGYFEVNDDSLLHFLSTC